MKRKVIGKLATSQVVDNELTDATDSDDAFEEKVRDIKKQLGQLDDKTHPDYVKVKRKLDVWFAEEKQRVQILHEHRLETIAREFKKESEICDRDCELEKKRIQDYLVSLCEELKRRLEHDKRNIELTPTGDILDFKPAVTRKLRRRAGTELPSAASANFMYWGDLLLCGTGWPLNSNRALLTDASLNTDLKSPVSVSGAETNQYINPAAGPDGDYGDAPRPNGISPTRAGETTALTTMSSSNSFRSNLFGSLGVNLFDGSLLSHLLASINNSSNCFLGSPPSTVFSTGTTFSNGFYNVFSGPPSGSAAAAVAAGLMLPSALSTTATTNIAAALNSVAINLTGAPPSSVKKRRQQGTIPTAQLNLLLPENDIYADLMVIHRACAKAAAASGTPGCLGSSRKQSQHNTTTTPTISSPTHVNGQPSQNGDLSGQSKVFKECGTPTLNSPSSSSLGSPNPYSEVCTPGRIINQSGIPNPVSTSSGLSVWIDDGRLYCGQKCFQYGASVVLEGREGSSHRCTGTIVAIGAQDVAIRRSSDHGICRVTVQQLKQGRYALWPAKSS